MSKKKPQLSKYCRIFQWIEAHDDEFAGAIRDLCLEGALSPGHHGVTFLYPKDDKYRAEITAKAYSDDADAAVKMIESLIIPDALTSAAEFSRRDVGNKLGVKFTVESAEGSKVKLAGDVELTMPNDFHTLAHRAESVAVWVVTKGRPPMSGADYKRPAGDKKKRGGAAAAGPRYGGGHQSDCAAFAASVEAEYDRCMRQDGCRSHNPYLGKVVSLLNFLRLKSPETLTAVLPVLDFDPVVCFYLLVEPYRAAEDGRLIPAGLLFGDDGWKGTDAFSNAVEEFKGFFRSLADQKGASAADPQSGAAVVPFVFRDRAAVASQVDVVRANLTSQSTPREAPRLVQGAYDTLASRNTIDGLGPVLPDATRAALQGKKKLWQDEFRFVAHAALAELRAEPYTSAAFASIVRDIFRDNWPGNNYAAEIRLSNVDDLKISVAPRAELLTLLKFINSTDFLYTPTAPETVGGAWGTDDPNDPAVYNRNAVALAGMQRTTGMVRPSGVSPQTLQELQIYVQSNGKLPEEILALAAK